MGLWFVDSFDHNDLAGPKYANPDNPHQELEFQTGEFNSVLKRTGRQSFRGTIRKWHGLLVSAVKQGLAFHFSTIQAGALVTQFNIGSTLTYTLVYDGTNLTAMAGANIIAGPTAITILEGWNYLEWSAELHPFSPGDDYTHEVRLNGVEIFLSNNSIAPIQGPPHYTTILERIGNIDDYYMLHPTGGIHNEFLGPIRVHALHPIADGVVNTFQKFLTGPQVVQNYVAVDEISPDDDISYVFGKSSNKEDTYQVEEIDPAIRDILGFQWNNYARIPPVPGLSFGTNTTIQMRHLYYNPDVAARQSSQFDPHQNSYEYRTELREFALGEIEPGHSNTGAYINDSRFGFKISTTGAHDVRISQFCIEIVTREEIDEPDPAIPPDVVFGGSTFKYTKLWRIVLSDGSAFRFTSHNIEVTHIGEIYTPVASLLTSAIQKRTGLDPTNAEATGIIETLAFNSFLMGKFRGATITEYVLSWLYPWAGVITSHTQVFSSTQFDGAKWKVELSSITEKLLLPKGEVFGRTCRYTLGDSGCKVNLTLLEQTNLVAQQIVEQRTQINFTGVNIDDDAFGNVVDLEGYWNFGSITWLTGANAGLSMEIRSSVPAGVSGVFLSLQIPTPFDIMPGDTISATPGCNKLYQTCKDKFENPIDGDVECGNTKNFGGFPTMPGKDGLFAPIKGAVLVRSARHLDIASEIRDFLLGGLL